MLATISTSGVSCIACRLRTSIAAKQVARARGIVLYRWARHFLTGNTRLFATTIWRGQNRQTLGEGRPQQLEALLASLDEASKSFDLSADTSADEQRSNVSVGTDPSLSVDLFENRSSTIPEEVARQARHAFGDALPEGYLDETEYTIYQRLYGEPIWLPSGSDTREFLEEAEIQDELAEGENVGTGLLRENMDGILEEVELEDDMNEELEQDAKEDAEVSEKQDIRTRQRLEKTKKGRFFMFATKEELDALHLDPYISKSDEASLSEVDEEWLSLDEAGRTMYVHDVRYMKLERLLHQQGEVDQADELLQLLFLRYKHTTDADRAFKRDDRGPMITMSPTSLPSEEEQVSDEEPDFLRMHPSTRSNKFGTLPTTIQIPKSTFSDPITVLTSGSPPTHLSEAAHRIFGGVGLPYSTANPSLAKTLQQKPIPLDAYQSRMSDIEADAFLAAVMPGIYASVTSVVVETRKRLGTSWLENLMSKEGGPRILDAGGAGAGVLAVQDVLKAEWESMHDTSDDPDSVMEVTEAGGKTGGPPIPAPVGRATVLTASDILRQRASALLDDTAFVPRLPDYVHASDESAREKGKFDIIIAPHTLWPLKEDYLRKQHVANLWSLLSSDGGVLVLLEKGVPRGFEMVAGARQFLLDKRISSPEDDSKAEELDEIEIGSGSGWIKKDKGMIIAPCTNHNSCPMYVNRGISKGRKDLCHFEQRFIRPPFLQKLLGAKDKNHEDVQFSYVSIMRGRDLRDADEDNVVQGAKATDRAFAGYEKEEANEPDLEHEVDPTAPAVPDVGDVYRFGASPNSLSLPRAILPPLKRTGHVILDLCTPSGTLERWTVPRSFSKQAFRDARKSSWGDLWALGAKTRVLRSVRLGQGKEELGGVDRKGALSVKGKSKRDDTTENKKRRTKAKNTIEVSYDSEGRIKEEDIKLKTGGRMRQGKVKGIRDKRDKKATGRGRRKELLEAH